MTRAPPKPLESAKRLRVRAEQTAARWQRATAAPTRPATELAHELDVHRIELEMQNEELRRTQAALEAARDRYLDLYESAPVGYFTLDADGLITEANLTCAQLLGQPRGQLVGSRFERYLAPAERDRWFKHARALLQHDRNSRIELEACTAEGHCFHAQLDGRRARDGHVHAHAHAHGPWTLRITITDVTERRQHESELRLAATAFESQEGMMITDARGVIERVNKAFTQITGYSASEAIGQTAHLLQSGRHNAAFYAGLWDGLKRTGAWQGEVWNRRKSGELYAEWLTITAVQDSDATVTRYVGTMLDISQRKAREEEIAQLAFYDPLTGLPNRRLMKDRLHQAMALSARAHREGALIFIDLDHFKDINDTLGHDQGDLLLQQVAQRLSACVREGDTVARLGGDEFVVMLNADLRDAPEAAASQARSAAEKILVALSQPYAIAGADHHSSASIGVALFSGHRDTVDELLKRADLAMYQAKSAGRNTLRFFDATVQQAMRQRATLEGELRHALQHGELALHYQPVVNAQEQLLGAEALVRWQHPQRGLLEPQAFITIAEDRGLIQAIGRWVLETACAQLAAWAGDPVLGQLTLSVNVSARELRDPHFVAQVIDVLDRTGATPARLKLELTESVMLDNVEDSIAKMQAIRARGVGFALDDFGTGYASLTYLRRLPLDQLKIDRSFVRDVPTDTHDAAIARTIVDLGSHLGMTVVAEGVETPAQRDHLAGFGCHVFQGYLFGRPEPVAELVQMALGLQRAGPSRPS